ncbi:hypothetical protein [Arthrobacter sp. HLT1-21]
MYFSHARSDQKATPPVESCTGQSTLKSGSPASSAINLTRVSGGESTPTRSLANAARGPYSARAAVVLEVRLQVCEQDDGALCLTE